MDIEVCQNNVTKTFAHCTGDCEDIFRVRNSIVVSRIIRIVLKGAYLKQRDFEDGCLLNLHLTAYYCLLT